MTAASLTASFESERTRVILWRLGVALFVLWLVYLVRGFEWERVIPSWQFILRGMGRSWLLALVAIAIGGIAAIPLALARVYGPPGVRHVAVGLIEAVRSTPELMIVFWVYFTLPIVTGSQVGSWEAAIGSLSVIAAAYLAEVVRAGLYSVPIGQSEAAASTGLGAFQTFRYVVVPQAIRNMLPALMAQLAGLFKATALVYAIGVMEFFRSITVTNNAVFAPYALYLTLGVGYFLSCFAITRLVKWFDPKYQILE